jgi:hypothetical protein
MLIAVGMYLPFETTFAIFVGGIVRWMVIKIQDQRKHDKAQKARAENTGILLASGLIAGEALMRLGMAGYTILRTFWKELPDFYQVFPDLDGTQLKYFLYGLIPFAVLVLVLYKLPLLNAGKPEPPDGT